MSIATKEGTDLIKEADALVVRAYTTTQVADSFQLFLTAADCYEEAGAEDSARWAQCQADRCQQILARRVWD